MNDQANRPHRKTKEKKKHTDGKHNCVYCRKVTESVQRLESKGIRIRKSRAAAKASSTLTRCTFVYFH